MSKIPDEVLRAVIKALHDDDTFTLRVSGAFLAGEAPAVYLKDALSDLLACREALRGLVSRYEATGNAEWCRGTRPMIDSARACLPEYQPKVPNA